MRSIKEPEEIELLQKACNITEKGVRRLLSFIETWVWEYEIEAELMHEFLRNRSKGLHIPQLLQVAKTQMYCIILPIICNVKMEM